MLDRILTFSVRRRWVVLGLFMLVAGLSQALWLNFAPLLTMVQARYGVSEGVASSLVLVFPLVYVLLSVHAGQLTDRRGYRFTMGLSAVVMATFACLRIEDGGHFAVVLVAQLGIAAAQPYAVNGISKLVADWFAPAHHALATGLGTMGMFLGMAVGMAATPAAVEALGYRGAMGLFAVVAVGVGVAVLALVRENPEAKHAPTHVAPSLRSLAALHALRLRRRLLRLRGFGGAHLARRLHHLLRLRRLRPLLLALELLGSGRHLGLRGADRHGGPFGAPCRPLQRTGCF